MKKFFDKNKENKTLDKYFCEGWFYELGLDVWGLEKGPKTNEWRGMFVAKNVGNLYGFFALFRMIEC